MIKCHILDLVTLCYIAIKFDGVQETVDSISLTTTRENENNKQRNNNKTKHTTTMVRHRSGTKGDITLIGPYQKSRGLRAA